MELWPCFAWPIIQTSLPSLQQFPSGAASPSSAQAESSLFHSIKAKGHRKCKVEYKGNSSFSTWFSLGSPEIPRPRWVAGTWAFEPLLNRWEDELGRSHRRRYDSSTFNDISLTFLGFTAFLYFVLFWFGVLFSHNAQICGNLYPIPNTTVNAWPPLKKIKIKKNKEAFLLV